MPNTTKTILTFAARGYDKRRALYFLGASLAAGLLVLLVSYWLSSALWAAECEGFQSDPDTCTHLLSVGGIATIADQIAIFLLAAAHFVLIPAFVAAAVGAEQRSGTLEQLRTTPVEPRALLAGFVFGRSAGVYLALVGFWAVRIFATAVGALPFWTFMESSTLLIFGGVATSAVGAIYALVQEHKSVGLAPVVVAGVSTMTGFFAFLFSMVSSSAVIWALLHPVGALFGSYHRLADSHLIYGQPTPERVFAPLFSVAFCIALIWLVQRPACRRLRAPMTPLLRHGEALALFLLFAAATILPAPDVSFNALAIGSGCCLLPLMAVLVLLTQPDSQMWLLQLRRHSVSVPWRLAIAMLLVFLSLVLIKARTTEGNAGLTTLWLVWAGLSLGLHMHFAKARFANALTRGAFLVAIAIQFFFQLTSLANLVFDGFRGADAMNQLHIEAGFAVALVVPAVVAWRLVALRQRSRAERQIA